MGTLGANTSTPGHGTAAGDSAGGPDHPTRSGSGVSTPTTSADRPTDAPEMDALLRDVAAINLAEPSASDSGSDTGVPHEVNNLPDDETVVRRQEVIDRIMRSFCATLESKVDEAKAAPKLKPTKEVISVETIKEEEDDEVLKKMELDEGESLKEGDENQDEDDGVAASQFTFTEEERTPEREASASSVPAPAAKKEGKKKSSLFQYLTRRSPAATMMSATSTTSASAPPPSPQALPPRPTAAGSPPIPTLAPAPAVKAEKASLRKSSDGGDGNGALKDDSALPNLEEEQLELAVQMARRGRKAPFWKPKGKVALPQARTSMAPPPPPPPGSARPPPPAPAPTLAPATVEMAKESSLQKSSDEEDNDDAAEGGLPQPKPETDAKFRKLKKRMVLPETSTVPPPPPPSGSARLAPAPASAPATAPATALPLAFGAAHFMPPIMQQSLGRGGPPGAPAPPAQSSLNEQPRPVAPLASFSSLSASPAPISSLSAVSSRQAPRHLQRREIAPEPEPIGQQSSPPPLSSFRQDPPALSSFRQDTAAIRNDLGAESLRRPIPRMAFFSQPQAPEPDSGAASELGGHLGRLSNLSSFGGGSSFRSRDRELVEESRGSGLGGYQAASSSHHGPGDLYYDPYQEPTPAAAEEPNLEFLRNVLPPGALSGLSDSGLQGMMLGELQTLSAAFPFGAHAMASTLNAMPFQSHVVIGSGGPFGGAGPSTQVRSPTSTSGASHSGSPEAPRTKHDHDDDAVASDHDGRRKKPKRVPADKAMAGGEGKKFACPYFKRNRKKYSKWTSCPGPGWDEVHRVKTHLYRRHALPIQCPRCWGVFKSDELLRSHLQQNPPCEISENRTLVEGFTKDQEKRLRSRKKAQADTTDDDKWREIYTILFPDDDEQSIPSAYYEPTDYLEPSDPSLTSTSTTTPDSSLEDYTAFVKREMPTLVRRELEALFQTPEFDDVDARFRSRIADIVVHLQPRLVDLYKQSQLPLSEWGPGNDSSRGGSGGGGGAGEAGNSGSDIYTGTPATSHRTSSASGPTPTTSTPPTSTASTLSTPATTTNSYYPSPNDPLVYPSPPNVLTYDPNIPWDGAQFGGDTAVSEEFSWDEEFDNLLNPVLFMPQGVGALDTSGYQYQYAPQEVPVAQGTGQDEQSVPRGWGR